MSHYPHFCFSGTPEVRGLACGETLRERIRTTVDLYADRLFSHSGLASNEIEQRANSVREIIAKFSPIYPAELDAIARGANLARWQIYALNARTEILNTPVPECTAMYFSDSKILGQNWDWVAALEELAVLITWKQPNGHQVLTFTEPGMLGKIGLNNRGLGVCLNIMFAQHELDGVPVHVLIRALLDCVNLDEARTTLERSGFGKSSHLLVADDLGHACSTEFVGDASFEVQPDNGVLLHTNHCIAPAAKGKTAPVSSTLDRLEQSSEWLAATSERDVETMRQILLDDSRGSISINTSYHPEKLLDGQNVGTCATILMDLAARDLHIKKGPGKNGEFSIHSF
jgi:isopenicillin-N N-acyltransferase-like protein